MLVQDTAQAAYQTQQAECCCLQNCCAGQVPCTRQGAPSISIVTPGRKSFELMLAARVVKPCRQAVRRGCRARLQVALLSQGGEDQHAKCECTHLQACLLQTSAVLADSNGARGSGPGFASAATPVRTGIPVMAQRGHSSQKLAFLPSLQDQVRDQGVTRCMAASWTYLRFPRSMLLS